MARFPMARTIEAALPLLRRPFTSAAVRAKVQAQERSGSPRWGRVVRYVDARLVAERLNLVAGGQWSYESEPLGELSSKGEAPLYVICRLTVLGQTHTDVGEGHDPKAAFSDALKRAAVPFGIARSLYALPARLMYAEDGDPAPGKLRRRGDRLMLTEANEALLREEYEQWLADVGIEAFGAPLDHGPDAGSEPEERPARPRLRAVEDETRGEEEIGALAAQSGYAKQTVRLLAELLGRGGSGVGELRELLELARSGAVTEALLASALRGARREGDAAEAVRRLRVWLERRGTGEGRAA